MSVDDDFEGLLPIRVDKPKPSGSFLAISQRLRPCVSHDDAFAARIVADVVGVVRELHRGKQAKTGAIVDFRASIQRTGDVETVGGCVVEDSLRLRKIGNRVSRSSEESGNAATTPVALVR